MTTETLLLSLIALAITYLFFHYLIQSATKSKEISKNSAAQLKVLIEMALASGVPSNKIENEIAVSNQNTAKQAEEQKGRNGK